MRPNPPRKNKLTQELAAEITEYLFKHAPRWASFAIRAASDYLGCIIGPAVGNDTSWDKALQNFNTTVNETATAKLAPSVGTGLYAMNVSPRLSYIPQLCTPPKQIHKIEKHATYLTTPYLKTLLTVATKLA